MTTAPARLMRSRKVTLGLTLLAASSITTGCGKDSDAQAICVDPHTHLRVDDDQCEHVSHDYDGTGGGFFWWYMLSSGGHRAPGIGQPYNPSYGTYNSRTIVTKTGSGKPVIVKGGVPSKGGTITRGGFGGGFGKASS